MSYRALVYVHRARVYVHRARVYINRTLCVDLARAYFRVWDKIDPHTKKVPYFKHLGLPRFFTKTEHVLPPFFLWKTEHLILQRCVPPPFFFSWKTEHLIYKGVYQPSKLKIKHFFYPIN